jgi:hypothetical protein
MSESNPKRSPYIKAAGIAWALTYFALGAVKSFTINANDSWAAITLLLTIFLVPLPMAAIAVWRPILSGRVLLASIVVTICAVAAGIIERASYPLTDKLHFIAFVGCYSLPHLFFGLRYIGGSASHVGKFFDARLSRSSDAADEKL